MFFLQRCLLSVLDNFVSVFFTDHLRPWKSFWNLSTSSPHILVLTKNFSYPGCKLICIEQLSIFSPTLPGQTKMRVKFSPLCDLKLLSITKRLRKCMNSEISIIVFIILNWLDFKFCFENSHVNSRFSCSFDQGLEMIEPTDTISPPRFSSSPFFGYFAAGWSSLTLTQAKIMVYPRNVPLMWFLDEHRRLS